MEYEVIIVDMKCWEKDVGKIPKIQFLKIKEKIMKLSSFPESGDIKKLVNFPLKVLLYRILHRKDSY